MPLLKILNLYKETSEDTLLAIQQLQLSMGDKVGFIGQNGSGKSSLLKILVGEDKDFKGKVQITPSLAYVPQLSDEALNQSGGERVMSYLKEAFQTNPDLLILDEPTSHLDAANKEWLVHQLRRFRGGLLIVSHDRHFLDQLVTTIWHLEKTTITVYPGNYSAFEEAQAAAINAQWKAYQTYQDKVHQLEGEVQHQKTKAKALRKKKKTVSSSDWKVNSRLGAYDSKQKALAQRAKAMTKRLSQLEKVDQPQKTAWAKLKPLGTVVDSVGTLIHLNEGQVSIGDRELFFYPELWVRLGDRIVLKGRNKTGKSTFIKQLLSQQLAGYYSSQLEISYFSQGLPHITSQKTPYEWVAEQSSQDRVVILNHLAMFGLPYQKNQRSMAQLSGGEQVRASLVRALLADSNCLILDEPTNFLDLTAQKALEQSLSSYQGALVIVSHDRAFTDKVEGTTWEIAKGKLEVQKH